MANSKLDDNRKPLLTAVSSVDSDTPVRVTANPTSGALKVEGTFTTGSVITEYTEGDTDATITGQSILWEDAGDTLRTVSAATPLPVTMSTDIQIGAVEIKDGDSDTRVDVETDGTKNAMYVQANDLDIRNLSETTDQVLVFANTAKDGTGTDYVPLVDADGHLQMDILSSALPTGAATAANQTTIIGHVDGIEALLTTIDADTSTIAGAVSGTEMQVDVLTTPATAAEASALPSVFMVVAGDDGTDTHPLQTSATGDLKITLDSESVTTVTAGDIAHDAADSGNPVKVGGVAYNIDGTAPGTAVTEGDRAEFATDLYGRQLIETVHPNLWSASENNATAQTNNSIKTAPGAGLSLYITDIIISNGATAGSVKIVEDTAGTPIDILEEMYFAANGGAVINLKTPIKVTANTDVGYTSTTVTTHSVTLNGYIAP